MINRDLSLGFKLYSKFLGYKLYVYIFLFILSGLLEGVGLALFVPLLSIESIGMSYENSKINNFIFNLFSDLDIALNLQNILALIVIVFITKSIFLYCAHTYQAWLSINFITSVKKSLMNSIFSCEYNRIAEYETGKLSSIVIQESGRASSSFNHFSRFLSQMINTIAYLGTSLIISYEFTLLAIGIGAISYLFFRKFPKWTRQYSLEFTKATAKVQDLIIEMLKSFLYLKSTNKYKPIKKRLFHQLDRQKFYEFKTNLLNHGIRIMIEPVSVIGISIILYVEVVKGGNPLQNILVSAFLFKRILSAIIELQSIINSFAGNIGGLDAVINLEKAIESERELFGKESLEKTKEDSLEFKNVSYSINDTDILKDISLSFEPNKCYAIVGSSGSGKSTFLNLISGLIKASSGEFLVNQRNSKNLNLDSLRDKIGYVVQKPVIFNDSIESNITLWEGEIDTNRLRLALDLSNSLTFIENLREGVNTKIGEGGVALSGGQLQRISLARELYKSPEILILDEATSALDSISEKSFFENLEVIKQTTTVFMVSHRISTIKKCDRIIVLDEGKVIESGTFDYLLSNNQLFQSMYEAKESKQDNL